MASSTDNIRSTIESTVFEFLNGQTITPTQKDTSRLLATLLPECEWHLAPSSFTARHPFLKAVRSVAEQEAHFKREIGIMEEAGYKVLDSILIDTTAKRASFRVELWAKINNRERSTVEVCWFLDFTDDGKKIKRATEFVDTFVSSKMIDEMASGGYNMEKEGGEK
ncbi:hypothetical protein M426DRAFT_323812 [Hypoxylon sp. CI-4A]|nr:hypothetical protein M426DRAFT_323812 [Hypoxylon sp. CI-4A]